MNRPINEQFTLCIILCILIDTGIVGESEIRPKVKPNDRSQTELLFAADQPSLDLFYWQFSAAEYVRYVELLGPEQVKSENLIFSSGRTVWFFPAKDKNCTVTIYLLTLRNS